MSTKTESDGAALRLLGHALLAIRGLAREAADGLHVSKAGRGPFSFPIDSKNACARIYAIADAAHHLPGLIAAGEQKLDFLFEGAIAEIRKELTMRS